MRQARSPGHKPRTAGGGLTDSMRTPAVGRDHMQQARVDALAYLQRTGNADVAEALGLVDTGRPVPHCLDCGHPLPDRMSNGGHKPCQRRACKAARADSEAS